MVRCLRAAPGLSPAEQRDCLATIIATIAGLRPSEGARLQVCDLKVGFDARRGASYHGSAALNIMCRKNDQIRKGLHPRLGRTADPALDEISLVLAYLTRLGINTAACCLSKGWAPESLGSNRWKWARKGPLRGLAPHQQNPELPGCFVTI